MICGCFICKFWKENKCTLKTISLDDLGSCANFCTRKHPTDLWKLPTEVREQPMLRLVK